MASSSRRRSLLGLWSLCQSRVVQQPEDCANQSPRRFSKKQRAGGSDNLRMQFFARIQYLLASTTRSTSSPASRCVYAVPVVYSYLVPLTVPYVLNVAALVLHYYCHINSYALILMSVVPAGWGLMQIRSTTVH